SNRARSHDGIAQTRTGAPRRRYNGEGHRESVNAGRPAASAGGSSGRSGLMKLNKEIRRLSRKMLQASFTDGQLDPGRIASLVDSLVTQKPRNYVDVLKNYKRLLRFELEKRHATI